MQLQQKSSEEIWMIDHETNLEIGDPDKLPFENGFSLDAIAKLQENVEKRIKYGTATPSGIRQIFDTTHGDENADYVDGISTDITDAAKIHVATIADCFAELIKTKTGKANPTLVVAIDSRHTGPAIADVAIRILLSHGLNIKYPFISPITEIAVYSREASDGFLYISSSHNPRGYNGLKLGLDDGRLLPGSLAIQFIETFQSRLKSLDNTKSMIQKLNSAPPEMVRKVYNEVDKNRKEARQIYAKFSDQIITGVKEADKATDRKKATKEKIQSLKLWIGIDPNGGARQDKEYLESWGFNVLEINSRPREDMKHELAPVTSACEQAKEELLKAQNEGKNIVAFLVYDTDGDRKNVVFPDGKGGAIIPGIQLISVLDIVCCMLDEILKDDGHKEIGTVINDATSSIFTHLGHYLDFTVKIVEVGEANVATGGKMLHEKGVHVPIIGEGSNGSVFNLELLVREPLHTVRTLINFITRPEITKTLLKRLGQENKYDNWHSPEKISGIFVNLLDSLPPSNTTDFFTDEGIRKGGADIPQELLKSTFDEYFESNLWSRISSELKNFFDGKPIAEFVNYEGINELRGKGNRKTGTGGYKIEFYIQTPDGDKKQVGWIWFRLSGTERGIIRKGVSISHWEMSPKAREAVKKAYDSINKILNEALDEVEREALKKPHNTN